MEIIGGNTNATQNHQHPNSTNQQAALVKTYTLSFNKHIKSSLNLCKQTDDSYTVLYICISTYFCVDNV